jgi:aryl-alcohol dehydrogenase-like predicted oxidoreductase
MKQRQLGTNGPMVSAIDLGCLSFGGILGATNEAASREALDAAWAAGITFYDTANVYGENGSAKVSHGSGRIILLQAK